jgi:hypothetical protein
VALGATGDLAGRGRENSQRRPAIHSQMSATTSSVTAAAAMYALTDQTANRTRIASIVRR